MLLHMLLTICDGLNVGSSTTSTISAPLGSSSTSTLATAGSGGGGGGAATSAGTDVTLFSGLELLSLLLAVVGGIVVLGGEECLALNLVFSMSVSSEVVVDGEAMEETPLSEDALCWVCCCSWFGCCCCFFSI